MNRIFFIVVLIIGFSALFSCQDKWNEHYNDYPETIDQSVWDAIQSESKYSEFVSLIKEFELDSIFQNESSFTLFVPNNSAFQTFNRDTGDIQILLRYHILDYVFNKVNVVNSKLVQTTTGKFTQIEFDNGNYSFSGVPVSYSSPLYKNGIFYEIEEVAYPLPNLYEFITENTGILQQYIDDFDSVLLDIENSKPLGINAEGNIIYDSVYQVVNYFDSIYFPVNREDRYSAATFILFDDSQYEEALTEMAQNLGMSTAEDIPENWQNEVLLPSMIDVGLFPNLLSYEDLSQGRLKNISGDSVNVDYLNINRNSKVPCSNGVVYKYENYSIPEDFYRGELRIEGEHLVDSIGLGIYRWKPWVKVTGSNSAISISPTVSKSVGAENDSLVSLQFPDQPFNGEFSVEFNFRNIFPQKYKFVWGANFRPSGLYQFFVNDVLIREFDTFTLRSYVWSSDFTEMFFPENGNNRFDAPVDNLTEYGDVKIRIKYVGPGGTAGVKPTNGFNIDFVSLIPTE